jgi:hypothetical protein
METKELKLIEVTKDGKIIKIHPLALANHQALGWVLVDETTEAAAKAAAEAQAIADKNAVIAAEAKAAQEKAAAEALIADAQAKAKAKAKAEKPTK